MAVKPIPQGYHSITPYLIVRGVPKLLDFLQWAFSADIAFHPHLTDEDGALRTERR